MNQLVLIFIAIAVIAGVVGFGGDGEASNVVWLLLFGSAGAAVYFFSKNRGEGQGSSRDYGPTSNDSEYEGYSNRGRW
ncbi:DUF1328 domain-containing protein [Thiocapsa sp.]|uniref:DUF1328 domain-containing protein n=1 Tax=Thiocapsa sp. TaxID=2024551 RepID=UPI003593A140